MSKKIENKSVNRNRVPDLLATQFIKDYKASITEFPEDKKVEFIEHILGCFDIVEKYWANQTAEKWKVYSDKENTFLKTHGKRLKMYRQTRMYLYYGDRHLLSEKNIYTTDQWNELSHEKQILSPQEFSGFFQLCRSFLYNERDYFLLEQNPEDEKESSKSSESLSGKNPLKGAKIKREAQDKKTCLNQEQTVLLMQYLQQAKVFLNDEYLKKTDFGAAFEVLTGYSQNTLRQDLGKVDTYQNKINLKELGNLLTRLQIAIDKDLKQK